MRWVAKAAVQRGLSWVPGGSGVNYTLQRHVTRQIPRSEAHFRLHAQETIRHFRALRRWLPETDPAAARLYEFGAGWDLITPLVFFVLGVSDQTLVDIRANLRLDQVAHTIRQIAGNREWLAAEAEGERLRELPADPPTSAAELRDSLGITYLAPCDARHTGLPEGSVDFVSSTYTLEHIPAADITPILAECRRLLVRGGAISAVIDMKDHYSYGDQSISPFNFLRYSDRTWRLVNSSLHFQNRLRTSDYVRLFESAGLAVEDEKRTPASAEDLATVRGMDLAPRFRGRGADDLASRETHLIALSDGVAGGRGG